MCISLHSLCIFGLNWIWLDSHHKNTVILITLWSNSNQTMRFNFSVPIAWCQISLARKFSPAGDGAGFACTQVNPGLPSTRRGPISSGPLCCTKNHKRKIVSFVSGHYSKSKLGNAHCSLTFSPNSHWHFDTSFLILKEVEKLA